MKNEKICLSVPLLFILLFFFGMISGDPEHFTRILYMYVSDRNPIVLLLSCEMGGGVLYAPTTSPPQIVFLFNFILFLCITTSGSSFPKYLSDNNAWINRPEMYGIFFSLVVVWNVSEAFIHVYPVTNKFHNNYLNWVCENYCLFLVSVNNGNKLSLSLI